MLTRAEGDGVGAIACRPARVEPSEDDQAVISGSASLSVQSNACALEELGAMALSWLDYDARPRVLVAADLTIHWANAAARAALARRRDVENRAGMLAAVNPCYQVELGDFITGSGAGISSWCVPRSDGDGHLLLRAQRVDWSDEGIFGLSFFGSGSDFEDRHADLDIVFGLTRSEHRVLGDLLNGHEPVRIATMHGVYIATIRSHIRSIYLKLNVSSREGLFCRVRPFRL